MDTNNPNISVVVPLYNEEESLPELEAWIERVMTENHFTYEIIFVDDGSNDRSWEVIRSLREKNPAVRAIRFQRNYGKSAGLYCGFEAAQGDVVITMDADLQDSPDEIPELYRMITEEGYDLVSGWKKRRYDPIGEKHCPANFFNATAPVGFGNQAARLQLRPQGLPQKGGQKHRGLRRDAPVLFRFWPKMPGFKKIGEKVVHHRARKYGVSKFGWERMIKGYLDLITVMFMTRFGKSPMYFFGGLGTLMFLIGGATAIYLIIEKLYKQAHLLPIRAVTDQPLFFIAVGAAIIGVQLFLAGFIGELIGRNSSDRNRYLIDDKF